MSLVDLWRTNPDQIEQYGIDQIVAIAGDGNIGDESQCSGELREYLSEMPTSKLAEYANKCLNDPFNNSGFVLQDIVNELGGGWITRSRTDGIGVDGNS